MRSQYAAPMKTSLLSGPDGLRRFRVPGSLSVALVSGMLATGSCGGGGTSAIDAAQSDVKTEMADAAAPSETAAEAPGDLAPADRPSDASADIAMDTPGPTPPDGAMADVGDASSPQDLPREFPVV